MYSPSNNAFTPSSQRQKRRKNASFLQKKATKACQFKNKSYLCTAFVR